MADHWRATRYDADDMRGTADGPTRRAMGWMVSVALTMSVVLLAWHYQV